MKINAVFKCKEPVIETNECFIEGIELMTDSQFKVFSKNLFKDYDFIERNIDNMYNDNNGIKHCILAMNNETGDGILIESSGYSNCQYSSFVPHIKSYINEQVSLVVAQVLSAAIFNNKLEFDLDEISAEYGINIQDGSGFINIFTKQLKEISDIEQFEFEEDVLYLTLDSDMYPNQGMKMGEIK